MALGCVRVDLTVRLWREVEGVEHTASWPWFNELQCCIDAPFDVCDQCARRLGLVEEHRRCWTQRLMANGTLAPLDVALTAAGQVAHKADGMWHLGAVDRGAGCLRTGCRPEAIGEECASFWYFYQSLVCLSKGSQEHQATNNKSSRVSNALVAMRTRRF
jgi:hypothetical protein